MFKNIIGITALSVLASLLGLVNQMVFAKHFGAGVDMDAYFSILTVPSAFSSAAPVILLGVIIPALKNISQSNDEQKYFASVMFQAIFICSVVLSVSGCFLSPFIVSCLIKPEYSQHTMFIVVSKLLWGMVGLSIVVAFLSALHNLHNHFMTVAITTTFPSLFILVSVIALSDRFGILSMPIGLVVGSMVQILVLLPFILKHSLLKFKAVDIFSGKLILLVKHSVLVYISMLPFTAFPLIGVYWANKLSIGSASYIGYSQSFAGFISVAIGYGLSTVALPKLADHISRNDHDVIIISIKNNLNYIFLVGAIIAGFAIVEAPVIIRLLFYRGAFSESNVTESVNVVRCYFVAAVFIACMNFMRNAYYANLYYRSLAIQSTIATAMYFVMSGVLSKVIGVTGIGVAYAVVWTTIFMVSIATLGYKNKYDLYGKNLIIYMSKITMLCAISSVFSRSVSDALLPETIPYIAELLTYGIVYTLMLYILNVVIFNITELDKLIKSVCKATVTK